MMNANVRRRSVVEAHIGRKPSIVISPSRILPKTKCMSRIRYQVTTATKTRKKRSGRLSRTECSKETKGGKALRCIISESHRVAGKILKKRRRPNHKTTSDKTALPKVNVRT